jgi:tetratricopeptide (TPR) repeat protein
MSYITLKMALLSIALVYYQPGFADSSTPPGASEIQQIQQDWARLYYMDEFKNANYRELQALAKRANKLSQNNQGNAEALLWDAIVLSTLAEKKGGLGALSLVTEAKTKLEKAEAIDPTVRDGSVYASLGTLYAKVPGWPIAFGSDSKAQKYFEKALALNPQGLDINYFYADFLAENGEPQRALEYIEKALDAPQLQGRPLADAGRRAQARKLRDLLQES